VLGVRLVRWVLRWLRGRLAALARAARDALRSTRGVGAAARLMGVGLALRLGWLTAPTVNVTASVRGPVTQEAVRNVVAWQLAMPPDAAAVGHGRLWIADDAEAVQLDRVLSLVCLSGIFRTFEVVFDAPSRALPLPPFDLGAPHALALGPTEIARLQRALPMPFDGRRTATNYLKIAHPRAFVVALSLLEDDDGFVGEELGKWLPHLHRFCGEAPGVAFCLLNRTMPSRFDDQPAPAEVSPVRSLGFSLADAIALAQLADAFIGRLDAFGLAASAAGRPGVYVDAANAGCVDAERAAWFLADASPEPCLDVLRVVLRERRDDA
jgi:hypothetical protein